MNVDGKHYYAIWMKPGNHRIVQIIDQRWLPHRFVVEDLATVEQAARAIGDLSLIHI